MSKARKISSLVKTTQEDKYEDREGLIYARVSSKRQEIEGSGLVTQEGRCKQDLEYAGVPYMETFPDSYSGGGDFMNRPAMREMLEYIDDKPHKKYVVVFDDLKRFARDVEFHFKLRAAFEARGVLLRCLNYNFDESPEGRFTELIMAGQAELEREQNKRQVVQKQKARLDLGYWAFGSKKGYQMTDDLIHGKISIPKEPEASILREGMEGFANGTFIRKIDVCRFLVEKGFWSKQLPERYIDKLTVILKDSFYAGYIEYPKWDVEKKIGKHQGIVSDETFNAIQKRLESESLNKRIRVDVSADFPLRGLLMCEDCNQSLTGAWSQGRSNRYAYYFCQNKDCGQKRVSHRKKDVEDGFIDLMKEQTLKSEVRVLTETIFNKVWKDEVSNLQAFEVSQEKEIRLLEEKLKQLANMAIGAKSETVRDTYEKEIEDTANRIESMKLDSAAELDLDIPYRTALNKVTGMLESPYKIWESVDVLEKQRLFFFIFDEKLPYSKKAGYRTDKLPCAVRLFEDFVTSNTRDVEMARIEPASENNCENDFTMRSLFFWI